MNKEIDFYIDIEYDGNIDSFDCGFDVFNAYLKYNILDDKAVIHYIIDAENDNLIAYFSLLASCIFLNNYDEKRSVISSNIIPAIELKMFSVDKKYRKLNLSGRLLDNITDIVKKYSFECVGAKTLILYSVPVEKVVQMYENSGFIKMSEDYSMYKSNFNNGCVPMYKYIE